MVSYSQSDVFVVVSHFRAARCRSSLPEEEQSIFHVGNIHIGRHVWAYSIELGFRLVNACKKLLARKVLRFNDSTARRGLPNNYKVWEIALTSMALPPSDQGIVQDQVLARIDRYFGEMIEMDLNSMGLSVDEAE
jgi:hypothetical protein